MSDAGVRFDDLSYDESFDFGDVKRTSKEKRKTDKINKTISNIRVSTDVPLTITIEKE